MRGGHWSLAAGVAVVGLTILAGWPIPLTAPASGHAALPPQRAAAPVVRALPRAVDPLAGGQSRLFVNSTDPAIVPNRGLRTNLTAYYTVNLPASAAFQVAAEETIGSDTAVFGFFQNDLTYPLPFFGVFSNVTDATLHLAYWSGLILSVGVSYDFALTAGNGTNWTLTVNGGLFGANASEATFDFGATEATWAGGVSFSEVSLYASVPATPSEIEVPLALAVLTGGQWYLPHSAYTYALLSGGPQWGVQGRAQDPLLAPGELVTGTAIANVTNGTELWSGGAVPVAVGLTLLGHVAPATGRIEAQLTVATVTGAPLPQVALYLSDTLGGSFSPDAPMTDGTGAQVAVLTTANVSVAANDQVTARVTLFGYIGSAVVTIEVLPAQQVFLDAGPTRRTVIEGSTLNFTITATNATGAPAGGVLLLFTISGGNAVFVPYTTTGADGRANVGLVFPLAIETLTFTVLASTPGYWGHQTMELTTTPPRPTFLQEVAPYVELATAVTVTALVVYYSERRRRRRQQPIPKLGLPQPPEEDVSPLSRRRP